MTKIIHKSYDWFPHMEETVYGTYATREEAQGVLDGLKAGLAPKCNINDLDNGFEYQFIGTSIKPRSYEIV